MTLAPQNNIYSGYSAHEHSILYGSVHSVPLDITLETLVAIIFVTVGLVLGSEKLRPISWSVWAGEIEKEGGARNPFRGFEDRIGFWDVRVRGAFPSLSLPLLSVLHSVVGHFAHDILLQEKRGQFAKWVREEDEDVVSTKS